MSLLLLILLILLVIADWYILEKAGEKGWKSLIPYYGSYILFKISGCIKEFWGYCISSAIIGVIRVLSNNVKRSQGVLITVLVIIILAFAGVAVYCRIKFCKGLSKSFGKPSGFAVGLFLLPFIFRPILGFSGAQYNGQKSGYGSDTRSPDEIGPTRPTKQAQKQMAAVIGVGGAASGLFNPIGDGVVIGRSECDIVVPDRNVSKNHCRIIPHGDRVYIIDLNSTNGTYVSGCGRIAPGEAVELKNGTAFSLGKECIFNITK